MLRSLLSQLWQRVPLARPARRRGRRPIGSYRPAMLDLEDRCLLSTLNEFPLPTIRGQPAAITAGPDGNVWFTDPGSDAIALITPDGSISEFPIFPTNAPGPITAGPDGNLWFGAGDFNTAIGQITPDGTLSVFPIPDSEHTVQGITAGPDGNVWFTEFDYPGQSSIGRITPDGQMTHFPLSGISISIDGITVGPDGNLWFSHLASGAHSSELARITPDGVITDNLAPGSAFLTAGPDGNIWETGAHFDVHGVLQSGFIQRVTLGGQVTEFTLPTATLPTSITVGPDGNLWFTEPDANQIGMITPDGQITEYQVPTPNSRPNAITAGPDGNIWFTERDARQIGEFVLNDATGTGAAPKSSPALAQALHTAAVDTVFTDARLNAVTGVSGQPSAAAVAAVSSLHRSEAAPSSQARPAVLEAGGLHHHAPAAEAADIAGLADPLGAPGYQVGT